MTKFLKLKTESYADFSRRLQNEIDRLTLSLSEEQSRNKEREEEYIKINAELHKEIKRRGEYAERLRLALERTAYALRLAYTQKPLRDMAETLAEADSVLQMRDSVSSTPDRPAP